MSKSYSSTFESEEEYGRRHNRSQSSVDLEEYNKLPEDIRNRLEEWFGNVIDNIVEDRNNADHIASRGDENGHTEPYTSDNRTAKKMGTRKG
jgi:hypothetical protein